MGGTDSLNLRYAALTAKKSGPYARSSLRLIGGTFQPLSTYRFFIKRRSCSAPCPSDALTGWFAPGGQADRFDFAGIRVPKYILRPSYDGALIVKEPFLDIQSISIDVWCRRVKRWLPR